MSKFNKKNILTLYCPNFTKKYFLIYFLLNIDIAEEKFLLPKFYGKKNF